jgi:hypothetical protein
MFSVREVCLLQVQSFPQSRSIVTTAAVILQALCKLLMYTGAITLRSKSESLLILHLVYHFMFYENDAMKYLRLCRIKYLDWKGSICGLVW